MDLSVSDAPVGRLLDGRYRIESLLARGGMATVYRATDTRLDRTVALKVMHAELAADDEFVARFISEARSAAKLSDPHIVGVFDQGEDEGAVFLAMEFIQGRTLRDVLRERGHLDADVSLEIYESVLGALQAAHHADIVHRDIKPENVLISDDGRVKVADFGLARATRSKTNNTTARGLLLGTVNYISPEQALGERATPRSDVYAAGIMLYELLTGRPPHTGPTDFVVVRAHIDEQVPPPSESVPVPAVVDDIVLTATARQPTARYADAGAFLAAVRLARASLATTDATDDVPKHASRPAAPAMPAGSTLATDQRGPSDAAGRPAEAASAFGVADAFHQDPDGSATPAKASPGAAESNPIDLANAFYHEAPPPPPPPAPASSNRTRVIHLPADGSGLASSAAAPARAEPGRADQGHTDPGRAESARAERRAHKQARRRRWRGPIMFFLVLLLAAAVTGGAWWYGSGRWTSTPALLNMEPAAAIAAAEDAGLNAERAGEAFSEAVESGLVVRTDPGPGEEILRDGTVKLIISQGPERYEVPDIKGMSREQVETTLGDRNLVAKFEDGYHAEVPKGNAISQDVDPGESVRPETVVTVEMSLGPQPIEITDYTGQAADEARKALEGAGFTVEVTEEFSGDVPAGVVMSQDPAGGEGFAGDAISLVVSKGPEVPEIPVPNVVGQRFTDAERTLRQAGFEVQATPAELLGNGQLRRFLTVTAQEPPDGTLPQGSTVTLTVALAW